MLRCDEIYAGDVITWLWEHKVELVLATESDVIRTLRCSDDVKIVSYSTRYVDGSKIEIFSHGAERF